MLPAPPGLAHQVVCAVWRELPPAMAGADVVSTVPANVYACLNVVARGTVRTGGGCGQPFPDIFLCGPMTAPLTTMASAPLRSLSVVLQPWLLPDWFGVAARTLVDAWTDGRALAPLSDAGVAQAWLDAVNNPESLGAALQTLARAGHCAPNGREDMCRALQDAGSVAAAAARLGVGARQFERRFGRAFGLSPKRWLTTRRFEASLVQLARTGEPLASVAAGAGYADQAHMTREYRQVAGHTPGQTRGALASAQSGYWAFRPAAADVGFVQSLPEDGR